MWKQKLKVRILHSLQGMMVESLFTTFLILLTLFITLFFHLILH